MTLENAIEVHESKLRLHATQREAEGSRLLLAHQLCIDIATLEDDPLPAACLILALVVLRDSDRAINATIRPTTHVTYYELCTKKIKVHLLI